MTLQPGARLGPYEILEVIGAGGMGEVYRARDTRLQRDVAIKVLPDVFASDPERLARFEREAQVLASISHPNIASIHGVEEQGGVRALVLELVEGETLADLIARREGSPNRLDIDDALDIARQIAEALEAAHEQGIIHRDLKPANVKVTPGGVVKVLDFGLAKLLEPASGGAITSDRVAITQSPTITSPANMTAIGMILGTAAYMSPEQAKGRPADKRSDVWGFGCVLYEILTGKRAFDGEDLSDVIATVLKGDADWTALPAGVPPRIVMLIQRCLMKDRRHRLASLSVALFVLAQDEPSGGSNPLAGTVGVATHSPRWRQLGIPLAVAAVVGVAAGSAVWLATRPVPVPTAVTRFAFSPTGRAALAVDNQSRDVTITPDGQYIVYKATGAGTSSQLYVRKRDQLEPTPFPGLAGSNPRAPFVSPDGQWVGFIEPTGVMLNKVSMSGGPPIPLHALDGASRGLTWGEDGSIVFATTALSTGLQRVSSGGGERTVLTRPNSDRGEADHIFPQFLPDGRRVLFTITSTTGNLDASEIAVLDLGDTSGAATFKVLVRGGSQAQYVSSGHLVYVAAGALRAVAFNPARLEVVGPPLPVQPDVVIVPSGTAEFDISQDGTLVFVAGGVQGARRRSLVWVDRQGHEEPVPGAPQRAYIHPRLSPDGTRVAVDIRDQDNDIWVWELTRQTLTRVTFAPTLEESPVWAPDGRRLIFYSQGSGPASGLLAQASDGTGGPQQLAQGSEAQRPSGVSADGAQVLFWRSGGAKTLADIFAVTVQGGAVRTLIESRFAERNAVSSPDGKWLAYEANDSGQFEISVRPYGDVNGGRWQVSTSGGTRPLWSPTGRELFYLAPDGALIAVPVVPGNTWVTGAATRLFSWSHHSGSSNNLGRTYDVSLDGKRFLMVKDVQSGDQAATSPTIVVVENWFEELKRLVPTRP